MNFEKYIFTSPIVSSFKLGDLKFILKYSSWKDFGYAEGFNVVVKNYDKSKIIGFRKPKNIPTIEETCDYFSGYMLGEIDADFFIPLWESMK